MRKNILCVILALIFIVLLVSCSKYECEAVNILQSGTYYMHLYFDELSSEVEIAQKNSKIMLKSDDVVILLSNEYSYILDTTDKTYTDFKEGSGINYNELFINSHTFKFEERVIEGENEIYKYTRNESKYQFIYAEGKLTKIIMENIKDGQLISSGELPFTSLTSEIPEDVFFDIPDGYEYVETID